MWVPSWPAWSPSLEAGGVPHGQSLDEVHGTAAVEGDVARLLRLRSEATEWDRLFLKMCTGKKERGCTHGAA